MDEHFAPIVLFQLEEDGHLLIPFLKKIDFSSLIEKVKNAKTLFELLCFTELFLFTKISRKVFQSKTNPKQTQSNSLSDFYEAFCFSAQKILQSNASAKSPVH